MTRVLIVDDGDRYAELAHALLRDNTYATRCDLPGPCWTCPRRKGCTLTHAHDLGEAHEALARHPDVDVVLLDLSFDIATDRLAPSTEVDLDRRRALQGLDILAALRRERPSLPIVLMTERSTLDFADAADAADADEYLTLAGADAFDARALTHLIERAKPKAVDADPRYVWGDGEAMSRLRRDVLTLARTSLPLLVLGETGTGKSRLAADVIHPASGRRGSLVVVDLAAVPVDLVASELFGTARGAFSGAVDRAGAFEAADGGTLFIDEVGNLPAEAQRVILVALDRGEITRIGETKPRPVDVKLVAATSANLQEAVRQGRFRADLLARLNPSVRIELPPLRRRLRDLPALVAHFTRHAFDRPSDRQLLARYLEAAKLPATTRVDALVLDTKRRLPLAHDVVRFVFDATIVRELRAHAWSGNLRDLRHVVTTIALLTIADATSHAGGSDLPISLRLVRDLLRTPAKRVSASTLHGVARSLEVAHYEQLYAETDGDFSRMAEQLLGRGGPTEARKVRLRFNQLGLRVRKS